MRTPGQQLLPSDQLDQLVDSITKTYGPGAIQRLGARTALALPVAPTDIPQFDHAIGVGGLPRGRIIELYGTEGSGKTTLCLNAIAAEQRRGGLAAFIDVEHALDPKFAKACGVNLNDLLISQPDNGEDALNIMETLIRTARVDIIVLDSVAALVTKAELEGACGDVHPGGNARLMAQAMRRLTAVVHSANTVCIFTNQIREKIGVMFGNPETTPGGRALKFFASVRIDVRRKDAIKDPTGKLTGFQARLKIVKNKVAPPFTECTVDLLFDEGLSSSLSTLDLGIELGILQKKGGWISYKGQLVANGRDAFRNLRLEKPQLVLDIQADLRDRLPCNQTPSAAAAVADVVPLAAVA